jgi:hypothetical protein
MLQMQDAHTSELGRGCAIMHALRCAAAREDGNAVTRGRKSCRSRLAADAIQKTNATLEIDPAA